MRACVLSIARPVAVVVATLLVAPPAFARTVRCESKNYEHSYCPVRTHGDVELVRKLSSHADCDYGRTWGYDHRGIWVDRGCRAEFAVDEGGRRQYDHYRHDDDYRRDDSRSGAETAGAILGAALAAAIVNNKHHHSHSRDRVPSWAVGRYEGFNTLYHNDVELDISPSGSVTGRLPTGQRLHGTYRDDRIEFSGMSFDIDRTGSGFTLTEVGNRDNMTVYHRVR